MKDFDAYKLLPEFPRTPHLPLDPNPGEGDVVAPPEALDKVFAQGSLWVEEKVDATNVGVCYYKGHFYVRNRQHILSKGYLHKNASGKQFRPLWNWLVQNQGRFQLLNRMEPFSEEDPATVYGEWMWMAHGIHYTALPSLFFAFDLYDARSGKMLSDRCQVRHMLADAGFELPRLLHFGKVHNEHQFHTLLSSNTTLCLKPEPQEGIYIRYMDYEEKAEKRYKMVRGDFEGGKFFRKDEIIRNILRKS